MYFEKIDLRFSGTKLDFGAGFYVTTDYRQAYARAVAKANVIDGTYPVVIKYDLNVRNVNYKRFGSKVTKDWVDCVMQNRIYGGLHHNFDVVSGVVADAKANRVVSKYRRRYLEGENGLWKLIAKELKLGVFVDQYSVHTASGVACLRLIGVGE